MKKLYLFLFLIINTFVYSQYFNWVKTFGNSKTDHNEFINRIEKDKNGFLYVLVKIPSYINQPILSDTPNSLNIDHDSYGYNANASGLLLAKLDKNGTLLWHKLISNSINEVTNEIKILDDNIYISYNSAQLIGNAYYSIGNIDIYDLSGNSISKNKIVNQNIEDLEIDKAGFLYVTFKSANSNIIFQNPINSNFNSFESGLSINMIKMDKNLKIEWINHYKNMYNKHSLLSDNSLNCYIIYNNPSVGFHIIKYDKNGTQLWKKDFLNQYYQNVNLDNNENIVIAGNWDCSTVNEIDTDPNEGKYVIPCDQKQGFYLSWIDKNGNFEDIKVFYQEDRMISISINDLYFDNDNHIYISGNFGSMGHNATFDTDPSLQTHNLIRGSGHIEAFSINLDSNKNFVNSFRLGSDYYIYPNHISTINDMLTDGKNYYYVGQFNWNANFNPKILPYQYKNAVKISTLNFDGFLLRLSKCSTNPVVSSNSPVCPNTDIKLQASGGTSYLWTGPNGFTSTYQNPIIPNATSTHSGTYSCVISGTGDCDGTFTVEVKVEDKTPPTPDIVNLPDIIGDCHTVVSTIPTATDNCSGKINATTTDALQYSIPGTYTITWKYDDGNGNTFTQNQKVIISSPALPSATSTQTFCAINAPKISNIQITGQNIIWYDEFGNVLNTNTPLIDGTTYYASQTINGCESNKLPILIKVNATPLPTGSANQDFCTSRNAQVKDLIVTGTSLKYYDNLGNSMPLSTVLQDNTSYFVTQTLNNCESPKFEIKVTLTANSLPAQDYQLVFCNDTTANYKTEDLRKYQENIITGSSAYSFEYFDQNNNSISDFANRNLPIGVNNFFVKVKSNDGCWKMVKLILQLNPKPVVNLPSEAEYCRGLFVELDAGSGYTSYLWNTGATTQKISVNNEGTYTVKVTNSSNCENSSSTLVKQSVLANIIKVEIFNNNAKVLLSASGDFEFSLDNVHWQDSNEFKNLGNGNHTMYVKTKMGCIIGQMNFTIFNIYNSFTPNGDGINDTWIIDGIESYPNSEIIVWNRHSTVVLKVKTNGRFQWNGYFNGRVLPTGTYWYIIKVSDGRVFQGSLLIKNRN